MKIAPPLPLKRDFQTLELGHRDWVAESKNREIRRHWLLASFSPNGFVYLYEFVPQGTSYLASIALFDHSEFVTVDYPAERVDSISVWRVDDEGKFCGECFEILFVMKGDSGYGIAINWLAFEGESLELLWSDGTRGFSTVLSSYRFWAPR